MALTDITHLLTGVSSSVQDLYQQIGDSRGQWSVKKVKFDKKLDGFLATAQNPKGEKLEGRGPDEHQAVLNLFMAIKRRDHMRSAAQERAGMWSQTFTDQLDAIAAAYAKAPVYDPKAASAFKALADDCVRRAHILGQQIELKVTYDPDPYKTAQDMIDDVRKRRRLLVSRAGIEHPIWTPDQVLAFRSCWDVLGVAVSGGGFDWRGCNQAFAALAPVVSAEAQGALFTETIARTAYSSRHHAYGPEKIALFPEFYERAQRAHGFGPGHHGVHPSQTPAPVEMPGLPPLKKQKSSRVAAFDPGLTDPNAGYQTGVEPLPNNAYLMGGDPLQKDASTQNASLIDTHWAELNREDPGELARMKQAIVNAFRVVLLSPRKDLRANCIHYQDIAGIPGDTSDPTVYWNTLEGKRQNWNVQRFGEGARFSHRPYAKFIPTLQNIVFQMDPSAGYPAAKEKTEALLQRWETEEQDRIMREDEDQPEGGRKEGFEISNAALKALTGRIKGYIKEYQPKLDHYAAERMRPGQESMFDMPAQPQERPERYPAWMGSHLKAIAQVSQHVDGILEAALRDVEAHDGTGHHFRAYVLQQGIPGVGPKVCSFAWLLLQPMTSRLATIDTHMLDLLGYKESDMNRRDYFKMERQLRAGLDAAGYGEMPLGIGQWSSWDAKRTGAGTHQDHSAMRVLDPQPHDTVDWAAKAMSVKDQNQGLYKQIAPQWWRDTEPARDAVGEEFDRTIGSTVPQNVVPYQSASTATPSTPISAYGGVSPGASEGPLGPPLRTPWIKGPDGPISGRPGDTIMQHARGLLGLDTPAIWELVDEAGKT